MRIAMCSGRPRGFHAADRSSTPPDAPVAELRRAHATLGVDRVVIVQASCHGSDNGRCSMPSPLPGERIGASRSSMVG